VAVEINTPFLSIESVAKAVGVPMKRAREIERLVAGTEDAARSRSTVQRRVAKARAGRRCSGRR
jgi:hypothetical protein